MSLAQLASLLQAQFAVSGMPKKRHIVQFRDLRAYQAFLASHPDFPSGSHDPDCALLPPAGAIRIALADPEPFSRLSEWVAVEPDRRVHVETRGFLPMTAGPPSSVLDPSQRIPWGVRAVHAPCIWRKSRGAGVRIGIVDTGVDFSHPDIKSALMRGVNLLNRSLPPFDDNGHGTHIAGTIAASNANGGIRGVAPGAKLYPIKAFDREGSAYVSDIILSIHWCIAHRIDIINMSFGMSTYSPSLHQAVKSAYLRNVTIVASSGNHGKRGVIDYPARFGQTIAVGALSRSKRIPSFSNRSRQVDVYAPGEAVYSTWPGGKYNHLNGTSMAAAHVSGVAALLLAARPGLSAQRLKSLLLASAVPLPGRSANSAPSPRMLDAKRAWSAMKGWKGKKAKKAKSPSPVKRRKV